VPQPHPCCALILIDVVLPLCVFGQLRPSSSFCLHPNPAASDLLHLLPFSPLGPYW